MNAVQFDVAYRFPEYRAFVFEHFTHVTGRRLGILGGSLVSIVAAVAFVRKKSKMPLCSFTVDETGIRRRTADGDMAIDWKDVTAVHRYSAGFLIEKERGAVPIPYRCLDEAQRSSLETLLREWEETVGAQQVAATHA